MLRAQENLYIYGVFELKDAPCPRKQLYLFRFWTHGGSVPKKTVIFIAFLSSIMLRAQENDGFYCVCSAPKCESTPKPYIYICFCMFFGHFRLSQDSGPLGPILTPKCLQIDPKLDPSWTHNLPKTGQKLPKRPLKTGLSQIWKSKTILKAWTPLRVTLGRIRSSNFGAAPPPP